MAVHCPRCDEEARSNRGCRHLRWTPARGGPIEFARSLIAATPRPDINMRGVGDGWWESQFDWLLERIELRLQVLDGYCFGEQDEVDRLCTDIWHQIAESSQQTQAS